MDSSPFGFFERRHMNIADTYILTVEEAGLYFHIGVNKLRRMINDHTDADWVLWNNTHACIKRKKFEQFIDSLNTL